MYPKHQHSFSFSIFTKPRRWHSFLDNEIIFGKQHNVHQVKRIANRLKAAVVNKESNESAIKILKRAHLSLIVYNVKGRGNKYLSYGFHPAP